MTNELRRVLYEAKAINEGRLAPEDLPDEDSGDYSDYCDYSENKGTPKGTRIDKSTTDIWGET